MVKIGSVELTEREAFRLYEEHKYIVAYRRVFELHYSAVQGRVYGTRVYEVPLTEKGGLTRRGRFFAMGAEEVNHLLGFRLVNEDITQK